jgi:hypothetical protein
MWEPLFDIWGTEAPAPNTSFPTLQAMGGMNFLRVSIEWYTYSENSSAFISALETVATVADQYNFKVVYEFNSYEEATFPSNVQRASGCGTGGSAGSSTDICFTAAYLTDSFNVKGQTVWAYQMANFWTPVISAVDSYPSTAGYEFANEPYNYYTNYGVSNANLTNIAAYNAYFSNRIRALTNRAIVINLDPWLYPDFDVNYGGNTLVPPASDCTVAGSCVIDIHWYILSEDGESTVSGMDSYLSANAAGASSLGMPIFVGEFAPCDADCTLTTSAAQTAINEQVSAAQTYGMGQTYFAWSCNQNSDPNDWIDMLGGAACSTPNTVATLVSNAYTSIMETSG